MADSKAPPTENEKQTLARMDDALNPPQHAEVPGHEAEQSSNPADPVKEEPETSIKKRPNSPPIPKNSPVQADELPKCDTAQGDKFEDDDDETNKEQPTQRGDAAGSAVEEETTSLDTVESSQPADKDPTSASHNDDREDKDEEVRRDETPAEEDTDPIDSGDRLSRTRTVSHSSHRSSSAESSDDDSSDSKCHTPNNASLPDDARSEPSETTQLLEGMADDSPSRREWLRRRQEDKIENEYLDKLMLMVGLESGKAHFLNIYASVQAAKRRDEDPHEVILDTVIVGNPGTGKKTVARLYADFLMSLELVPRAELLQTSGLQLGSENCPQQVLKNMQEMGDKDGGVVLVEEAHNIPDRRSVLEKLLSESAKSPPKIVLIVSSQGEETSDFTPGPRVNCRVPHIIKLPDYTDEELQKILVAMIHEKYDKPNKDIDRGVDGSYLQTFVSIIGRGRKTPNFGNVKVLRTCFSKLCDRRAKRLERERRNPGLKEPDHILFTKADMLGEKSSEIGNRSTAWKTLQSMIGLEKVKASVEALFGRASVNYYRELQGRRPIQITLNRCFLGPPGTGKTTVAKLFAQILADLGLVSDADVVIKPACDLIGEHIGHSERRTREALNGARRGVLIIDDVHMLLPGATHGTFHRTDIFRAAVIDTLVAKLQSEPGEGRAVILIGYTNTMYELFETSNPGLARRFPLEEAFHFTALNDDQLGQILESKLGRDDLDADPEAIKVAREMLSMARHRPNFGNGGHVENLLSQAKARYQARVSSIDVSEGVEYVLEPGDFDPDFARAMEARERCDELFRDMQGVEYIMAQFQGYQDIVARLRMRGHDPRPHIPLAFVFKGPPGTGKTTVARKVGQIFYDMGFLAAPELIECSTSDLVSGYVGHTGQKVIRMFERALGKVLFIDEAYRLGEMRAVDAIGEIVDCMTKERFARKIIIILAGYEDDMNKLMRLNRGLRSRFATDVIFRPMRPADSLALLGKLVGKLDIQLDGLTPANPSRGPVLRILAQLATTKSWANGRDVEAFSQKVIEYAFKHKATGTDPASKVIVHADELLPLLKSRLARAQKEDAEMAGNYAPDENAGWAPLNNDGSNSTHSDDEHEGTNIEVPGATTSTSDMILSNRDPGPSRNSRQAMTPGDLTEMLQYSPLQGRKSIRLLRLAPGNFDQQVSCCLIPADLDNAHFPAPSYLALSYVWGDSRDRKPILCDGCQTNITVNLLNALRRLRHASEETIVWADALCINQDDTNEREQQVQLMGQIYKQAARVAIYLGEGTKDLDLAKPLMIALSRANRNDDHETIRKLFGASYFTGEDPTVPPGYSREWDALQDFFRRPYFSRIWVFQEVILASTDPIVLCGDRKLEWIDVADTAAFYHSSGLRRARVINDQSFHVVLMAKYRTMFKTPGRGDVGKWNLLQLLRQTRNFKATDPRDKLFALYGIATDILDENGEYLLRPNYLASVEDIYSRLASLSITKKNLDVLSFARETPKKSPGLPSWVPDWRITPDMHILETGLHISQYQAASTNSVGVVRLSADYKTLGLTGMIIDTVKSKHGPFGSTECDILPEIRVPGAFTRLWENDVRALGEEYVAGGPIKQAFWRTLIANTDRLKQPATAEYYIHFLSWWRMIRLADHHAEQHLRDNRMRFPLVTLREAEMKETERMFLNEDQVAAVKRRYGEVLAASGMTCVKSGASGSAGQSECLHCQIYNQLCNNQEVMQAMFPAMRLPLRVDDPTLGMMEDDFIAEWFRRLRSDEPEPIHVLDSAGNTYAESLSRVITGRTFLITTEKLIGVGPPGAQPGDRIALFHGSNVPFVLRRVKGRGNDTEEYELIGEAYVHGVMDGSIARLKGSRDLFWEILSLV